MEFVDLADGRDAYGEGREDILATLETAVVCGEWGNESAENMEGREGVIYKPRGFLLYFYREPRDNGGCLFFLSGGFSCVFVSKRVHIYKTSDMFQQKKRFTASGGNIVGMNGSIFPKGGMSTISRICTIVVFNALHRPCGNHDFSQQENPKCEAPYNEVRTLLRELII